MLRKAGRHHVIAEAAGFRIKEGVYPTAHVRDFLFRQLRDWPGQLALGQELPNERVARPTQIRSRKAVSIHKREEEQQDGPEFLVDGLIFSLVFVVAPPIVEHVAERVQDGLGVVEEQENVQREWFARQMGAEPFQTHGLLVATEVYQHLCKSASPPTDGVSETDGHTSTTACAAAPAFPFMLSSSPISFCVFSRSSRQAWTNVSLT